MKKLKEYIEKKGLIKKRFCERVGIPYNAFSEILEGKRSIPKKYWKKIVKETGGEISLNDLVEYFLEEFEDPEDE